MIAITREPSRALERCELTHLERRPIDLERAREEHRRYEEALAAAGCRVERLAEEPGLPDSVFVEDAALVLEERAILTRPGAPSRRAERESLAPVLERYRRLERIEAPGTLDGGDVLRVGKRLWVGRSTRSNEEGRRRLAALTAPHGYRVEAVPVRGCLHLKSAVCAVAEKLLLLNPLWVDPEVFPGFEIVEVDPEEPFAANALKVGETLLHPAAHGRTRRRLEERGLEVLPVELSELAKAEGGVTCCSLLLEDS
jgi:dimethylargininase